MSSKSARKIAQINQEVHAHWVGSHQQSRNRRAFLKIARKHDRRQFNKMLAEGMQDAHDGALLEIEEIMRDEWNNDWYAWEREREGSFLWEENHFEDNADYYDNPFDYNPFDYDPYDLFL